MNAAAAAATGDKFNDAATLCKSNICHDDSGAPISAQVLSSMIDTTDPTKILRAATGMLRDAGSKVVAQAKSAVTTTSGSNSTPTTIPSISAPTPVVNSVERSFWQRNFEYQAPEDDLLHGHISDAQLAFYARNLLLTIALLAIVIMLWKFCAAHRCWQRRKQSKYAESMPLDYKAQLKMKKKVNSN
jgi:hypothetical protein